MLASKVNYLKTKKSNTEFALFCFSKKKASSLDQNCYRTIPRYQYALKQIQTNKAKSQYNVFKIFALTDPDKKNKIPRQL